jgi:hypothetical protein
VRHVTIIIVVVGVLASPADVITSASQAAQETPTRAVLKIVAPIVLDVSEDGKSIGSTEQPTLSLSPGKHVLTLSNVELGYTYIHTMDVEAGDVRTITLNPRVAADLRATPWAEVWMNGEKIGRTPIVHEFPLGTHELVFKHPRFGERHITATIRAEMTSPISVDMRKSK